MSREKRMEALLKEIRGDLAGIGPAGLLLRIDSVLREETRCVGCEAGHRLDKNIHKPTPNVSSWTICQKS